MAEDIKRMDITEFRENGYLQELNRRFLHPLGLALETIYDPDSEEKLGGIGDFRDDGEGLYFNIENCDSQKIQSFIKKKEIVDNQFEDKMNNRLKNLGFIVEPIKNKDEKDIKK